MQAHHKLIIKTNFIFSDKTITKYTGRMTLRLTDSLKQKMHTIGKNR